MANIGGGDAIFIMKSDGTCTGNGIRHRRFAAEFRMPWSGFALF